MVPYRQIEFVSSDSDIRLPCGKPAVAKCSDCGSAICSDCCVECWEIVREKANKVPLLADTWRALVAIWQCQNNLLDMVGFAAQKCALLGASTRTSARRSVNQCA